MKKAKIMLMAIAIVGVVGGALAFKSAKFFSGPNGICSVINGGNYCLSLYSTHGAVVSRIATDLYVITPIAPAHFSCQNTLNAAAPYYCTGLITTYAVIESGE